MKINEDWKATMDFLNSEEAIRARDEVLEEQRDEVANQLTPQMIQAEVADWADNVTEEKITKLLQLLVRRKLADREALYKALCHALSEKWQDTAEREWQSLCPPPSSTKFVYDNEPDLVHAINHIWAVLRHGGTWKFVSRDAEGVPRFSQKSDVDLALKQYRLETVVSTFVGGKKSTDIKETPAFPIWLKSPDRREYRGVMFHPDVSKTPAGYLNTWVGFGVQPKKGDWSLLRAHILDNVCQGNIAHYEFLLDWISQMFFEPGRKSGVIVVVRGKHGTGKSKLGEWLGRIVGHHAMVIEKGEHLTGKFNGHLELIVFAHAEEAVFAGDPQSAKALKVLGTEETFTYENKGVDARPGRNFTRVYMATNEDYAVGVEAGDRRYFVLDCGDAQKENKAYFAAIDAQMESGGAEAMLFDMLERKMTFAKLPAVPMTDGKRQQMRLSLSPQMQWLASALNDGYFPPAYDGAPSLEWPHMGGTVAKADVLASFQRNVPGHRRVRSSIEMGLFMTRNVPDIATRRGTAGSQRFQQYLLPKISDARASFLKTNPGFAFDAVEEGEDTSATGSNVTDILGRSAKRSHS